MKSLVPALLALAIIGDVGFSVFSSQPRIARGTTATDVTFSPAFSVAPKCTCSFSEAGAAPDTEELTCVATTTTLDVDVTGGGDPSVDADFICVGN